MTTSLLAAVVALAFASAAQAAPQTVTLSVPGMNCAACPITVKKSLTRVAGVSKAEVSLEKRQAVVWFDDSKTGVAALTQATTQAGFPSSAVKAP